MRSEYRDSSLLEISQELARLNYELLGLFRCPTCLRDYPISSPDIREEHILPHAVGGKVTTFLCESCNSSFGHRQTKSLTDWIELNEDKAPFHRNPKKQRSRLTAHGLTLNGSLTAGDDGVIEFWADRSRSNPKTFDEFWAKPKPSEISIETNMPVFRDEQSLRVGFLTAAYGLWFKNFGYSFVLQSGLNLVREQILNADEDLMPWNYLIETPQREIHNPCVGLMRFGDDIFPIALIYDHIVILPSSGKLHPDTTPRAEISKRMMNFSNGIAPRYRHRCVGPAVLICGGQDIIRPDFFQRFTVEPQVVSIDRWD